MRNASGPWTGSWTRLHWPKRSETICWERALHTLRTRRAYPDMSSHILTIRYDGVLAAPREMDGADSKAVIGGPQRSARGARLVLDVRADPRLIVHGYAPLYPAHSATPGSREDGFAINILANGVWHVAKFAAELTFAHFVDGQFQALRRIADTGGCAARANL